jgi:hypothetical protein
VTTIRRPRRLFADHRQGVVIGLGLFILGAIVLHDAYEGRGRNTPKILRPFTFW